MHRFALSSPGCKQIVRRNWLKSRYCHASLRGAGHSSRGPGTDSSAEIETPINLSAKANRDAELSSTGPKQLSRVQRGCLGVAGAGLATAGVSGLAWLHWPIMGASSACAFAGVTGMSLLAIAAHNPSNRRSKRKVGIQQNFDVKLINDNVYFEGEIQALQTLHAKRLWPEGIEAALTEADKVEKEALKAEKAKQAKQLLQDVKKQLAAGVAPDSVRQCLRPRLFVFDFTPGESGPQAVRPEAVKKQMEMLSKMVSFIIASASKQDEALLRLTSPGGAVSTYGLAASQLQRIRDAGIRLTVCVDKVAASGGYMMACVANEIVAAPFAMVGSIGVIAGMPNVHKLLLRNEVEFEQFTAGKYKRTLNVFTPNSADGKAKFREEIEEIHLAFQNHIKHFRPTLTVEEVATGEVWLGSAALERGLVDSIGTSDAQISVKVAHGFDAIHISKAEKKKQGLAKLLEGIGGPEAIDTIVLQTREFIHRLWIRLFRSGASAFTPRVEAMQLHNLDDK